MLNESFTERDWKLFQQKIVDWQERYMAKLNQEYIALLTSGGQASEIFWALESRIKKDRRSIGVKIEMKRSLMLSNLFSLLDDEVITLADLEVFSDSLKEKLLEHIALQEQQETVPMYEVPVENKLGLKVFINGIPKIANMPPERFESFISVLESDIAKFYEDEQKSKDKKE